MRKRGGAYKTASSRSYFSVWKGKLAKVAATKLVCAPTGPPLVPVTVRPNAVQATPLTSARFPYNC